MIKVTVIGCFILTGTHKFKPVSKAKNLWVFQNIYANCLPIMFLVEWPDFHTLVYNHFIPLVKAYLERKSAKKALSFTVIIILSIILFAQNVCYVIFRVKSMCVFF